MDKYIQVVKDFIPFKEFFDDLIDRYEIILSNIGFNLLGHCTVMYCSNKEYLYELLDYLDGNGFIIKYPIDSSNYVSLYPQYPLKIIMGAYDTWDEMDYEFAPESLDQIIDWTLDKDILARKRKWAETHTKFSFRYMEVARPPPI